MVRALLEIGYVGQGRGDRPVTAARAMNDLPGDPATEVILLGWFSGDPLSVQNCSRHGRQPVVDLAANCSGVARLSGPPRVFDPSRDSVHLPGPGRSCSSPPASIGRLHRALAWTEMSKASFRQPRVSDLVSSGSARNTFRGISAWPARASTFARRFRKSLRSFPTLEGVIILAFSPGVTSLVGP